MRKGRPQRNKRHSGKADGQPAPPEAEPAGPQIVYIINGDPNMLARQCVQTIIALRSLAFEKARRRAQQPPQTSPKQRRPPERRTP